MEKMNKEVKGAVKELLEKIPEEKLSEAVGGLSRHAKNALIAAGLIGAGAGIGSGLTLYAVEKSRREDLKNKREEYLKMEEKLSKLTKLVEQEIENLGKSKTSVEQEIENLYKSMKLLKTEEQVEVETPKSTE